MAHRFLRSMARPYLLPVALLCASASAQLNQAWVEKFTDPSYPESNGRAVAFLAGGDFIVAGYAAGPSHRDFLTVRYDAQGNQLWVRTYDGPQHAEDEARAVAVDSAGNVIVAGLSQGTPTSNSEFALATAKYAPDGTLLWTKRYERLGPSLSSLGQFGGLGLDSTGNVYVAGSMLASTPGATVDVLVVSYDPQGNQRWLVTHDGPNAFFDFALDLAVTPNDEVRVAGLSMSLSGPDDCATYAYSSNGTLLWVAYEPESNGSRVAVNSAGTTFVLGQAQAGMQVLAYDTLGQRLWATVVSDGVNSVTETALCPGVTGDVYVTGSTGSASFPPIWDMLTARLGPAGDVLWTRTYGDPGASLEHSADISVDGAGNAYVTGTTGASTVVGSYTSCLTVKYSAAGALLGEAVFGEPTGPFQFPQAKAHAVALADDASFVIVAGESLSTCTTLRYDHVQPPSAYCTSKPSSIASCTPSLGGTSSIASVSGAGPVCDVVCAPVPGGSKAGIAIASTGGPLNPPVLQTFGWLCIESSPAFFRLPADLPGGTNGHCDGYYEFDVRAWLASQAGNPALVAGGTLDLQVWYRDPPNAGGANLSNALGLDLVP